MFGSVERLRFNEMYYSKDRRPKKHRILEDAAYEPIKSLVKTKVIELRQGEKESNAEIASKNKKIKFLNFIINLHQKNAFRTWREKVFGTGGDPRLALLLMAERDRIRQEFFQPHIERRKNLKFLRKVIQEKNHHIAEEVRNSITSLRKVNVF